MSLPRLLKNFFRVGPINAAKQLWRTEDIKAGTLMGVDQFGNQYFQNEKEEPWEVVGYSMRIRTMTRVKYHLNGTCGYTE